MQETSLVSVKHSWNICGEELAIISLLRAGEVKKRDGIVNSGSRISCGSNVYVCTLMQALMYENVGCFNNSYRWASIFSINIEIFIV